MNKLLTIVVPVYNTEKYLEKCLDSLIIEEYLDRLEVLVVIDGSPDNSIGIARKFEKKYPNTFITVEKENGGHGSAINCGLALASGTYFRVLDSDDWFDKNNFRLKTTLLNDNERHLVRDGENQLTGETAREIKHDSQTLLHSRHIK